MLSAAVIEWGCFMKHKSCSWLGLDLLKWGYILILCAVTGTVRGQAKKNNVSIPWKTGKSTIVTHGTIRDNNCQMFYTEIWVAIPQCIKLNCVNDQIGNNIIPGCFLKIFQTSLLEIVIYDVVLVNCVMPNQNDG